MDDSTRVCLNGQFIPREDAKVAINDGGFLFGDTLFETMKAYGNRILLQWQHLDRLENAAKLLNFPCDRNRIETSLLQIAEGLTAPVSRLRLTLSRGPIDGLSLPGTKQGYDLITASDYQEPDSAVRILGIDCVSAPNRRVNPLSHLPQLKRGNYADCLYAFNHARKKGAREALFFDDEGNCLEGATSNIFAVIDERLVTPPVDHLVLDGIMRRQIIDTAAELGIAVTERPIDKSELATADEVFITNSLIDILPVARIDNQPIKRANCWQRLLETLHLRIST